MVTYRWEDIDVVPRNKAVSASGRRDASGGQLSGRGGLVLAKRLCDGCRNDVARAACYSTYDWVLGGVNCSLRPRGCVTDAHLLHQECLHTLLECTLVEL